VHHIVGASAEQQKQIDIEQRSIISRVKAEIDALQVETDGNGWRARVFLYCLEVTRPTTGWRVPASSKVC
jgi:putative DNA methylase